MASIVALTTQLGTTSLLENAFTTTISLLATTALMVNSTRLLLMEENSDIFSSRVTTAQTSFSNHPRDSLFTLTATDSAVVTQDLPPYSPSSPIISQPFPWPSLIALFILFDGVCFFKNHWLNVLQLLLTLIPAQLFYEIYILPQLEIFREAEQPGYVPSTMDQRYAMDKCHVSGNFFLTSFPLEGNQSKGELIQDSELDLLQKYYSTPADWIASKRQSLLIIFWISFILLRIYEHLAIPDEFSYTSILALFLFGLILPELRVINFLVIFLTTTFFVDQIIGFIRKNIRSSWFIQESNYYSVATFTRLLESTQLGKPFSCHYKYTF